MLYLTYPLDALIMITLPVAVGVFLARKLGVTWMLFGAGALTFIASQIVHIPLNIGLTTLFAKGSLPTPPAEWQLPFNAVMLGLTAGLSEELSRYLVYRRFLKSARTWRQALMFGAGHGGAEAIILGVLVAATFVTMLSLRGSDLSFVPADQRELATQQIAAFWSAQWYDTLLGAVERVSALCVQVSLAVIVLQSFTRNNPLWLGLAIVWHAVVDAVAVIAVQTWGVYWTEAIVGLFAMISLMALFALRQPDREAAPPESVPPSPVPVAAPRPAPDPLKEKLEETRYQ